MDLSILFFNWLLLWAVLAEFETLRGGYNFHVFILPTGRWVLQNSLLAEGGQKIKFACIAQCTGVAFLVATANAAKHPPSSIPLFFSYLFTHADKQPRRRGAGRFSIQQLA